MSTESSEFSPKMFIEDPGTGSQKKGVFVLKKELLVMLGTITIILILGILSLALSIHSLKELNSLDEKVAKGLEDLNIKIESSIAENNLYNGFERVGKYGYFLKLEGKKEEEDRWGYRRIVGKKMNYSEGQKACSKLYGHILEIPDQLRSKIQSCSTDHTRPAANILMAHNINLASRANAHIAKRVGRQA